jgi:hypothetical protein
MTEELFEQCKIWHRQHARSDGWVLMRCDGCVCEFLKDSFPLGVDVVRVKHAVANDSSNDGRQSFSYVHSKRYYRGSMPRVLEKKECICDQRDGFETLHDLLAYLAST